MAVRAFLESVVLDLRYAARMLRLSPGFSAIAVVSLALGIGANTAIFSLVNFLLLRNLPVADPRQLVEVLNRYPGEPRVNAFSSTSYRHYRQNNHVFSEIAGVAAARLPLRPPAIESEPVDLQAVTGTYFPLLGVSPAAGRLLSAEDDRPSAPAVAVLSDSAWNTRFHRNPAILGTQVFLGEIPFTIVGVAPPAFTGLSPEAQPVLWVPVSALHQPHQALALIARLKPGVSLEQARAEMTVLYPFTIEERAANSKDPLLRRLKVELEPAASGLSLLRDHFARPLLLLMAVVALLLLLACTNVASMLLARASARRREIAVRVSLGASRSRIIRLVLTEAFLLSAVGSLFGICLAWRGAAALLALIASGRPIPGLPPRLDIPLEPDPNVLLFALSLALLTALLFGLAPAWNAFSSAPASCMHDSARLSESPGRRTFAKSLVIAQVALSVVLLSGAWLFLRHVANLQNLSFGFRPDHVLLVSLDPSRSGYSREQLAVPYQELLHKLQAIPGVQSVSICAATPISGAGASRLATVEGRPEKPEDRRYLTLNWIAPRYFETLSTPLVAGRDFTFEDHGRSRVAIINQATARHHFPGADPIGKHITFDGDSRPYEIIGVAGDAKYYEIREAPPRTVYLNMFQEGRIASQFLLRTFVEPASIAPVVRRRVAGTVKSIPVARTTTLTAQIDASILPERLIATLSSLFGALGALLAGLGLYGLLAYTVTRRTNEIGVRMALGATPGDAVRLVLSGAFGMVAVGLVAGTPLALWGKRFASSLFPDLPPSPLWPMALAALVLMGIALCAAYFPARRAASVDPIQALRHE